MIIEAVIAGCVLLVLGCCVISGYVASGVYKKCTGCKHCSWDHQHVPEPKGHIYNHPAKPPRRAHAD